MNNLFNRLLKKKAETIKEPQIQVLTRPELEELLLASENRVRGLRSTIKHYGAMVDSVKEARKRHYAQLKDAAQKLLTKETVELETLRIAGLRFLN